MTISRMAVCVLLLWATVPWHASAVLAQGILWTDAACKARMEQLFQQAETRPKDLKAVKDSVADKYFVQNCGVKEALSIRQFERRLEQIEAEREELRRSLGRVEKAAGDPTPSGTAPRSSPKDEAVDKFLEGCVGKPVKAANCDKLKKDAVEILKEDLLRLGSTADRAYMPAILKMFRSDETVLRIAAADAIGMIGPQDSDTEALAPLTNDPVPDVRRAVWQMVSRGKGSGMSLLGQRTVSMRTGLTPERPPDPSKYAMSVAPNSIYLFESSDAALGRLSYVTKGMNEATAFFKGKAKKGPFQLEEFQEKFRYQIQDEEQAQEQAQEAAAKQIEHMKPPDPTNTQALMEYMQKVQTVQVGQVARMQLNSYPSNLFGSPIVYVLEERRIGRRSYPTRYVVLYQDQAFRKPGYRLSWMSVSDDAIKAVQAASMVEERQEEARKKEDEVSKQRQEALEELVNKKDAQEKKQFKKGQSDLEKELGF